MCMTVTGHFMALRNDVAHNARIALGQPSKREECRLRTAFVQQLKHSIDIAFDAAWRGLPRASLDERRKG